MKSHRVEPEDDHLRSTKSTMAAQARVQALLVKCSRCRKPLGELCANFNPGRSSRSSQGSCCCFCDGCDIETVVPVSTVYTPPGLDKDSLLDRYVDSGKAIKGDIFLGCVADAVEVDVTQKVPAWVALKNQGNDFLNVGDFEGASGMYSDAINRILDAKLPLLMLKQVVAASKVQGPLQRVLDNDDISSHIASYMPSVPLQCSSIVGTRTLTYYVPNRPLAICFANRAQANIKLGQLDAACEDAAKAVAVCPEYIKGWYRMAKAQEMDEDGVKIASDIGKSITKYQASVQVLPSYGCALVEAKWIDWDVFDNAYAPIRFEIVSSWLHRRSRKTSTPRPKPGEEEIREVALEFSMVPFMGLSLMSSARVLVVDQPQPVVIHIEMRSCDNDERASGAALLPHGQITQKARAVALSQISATTDAMVRKQFNVVTILLGRGLVDLTAAATARLHGTHPHTQIVRAAPI